MPIKRLSQSGLLTFAKHSSVLAGNAPFSPSSFDLLETTTLASGASSISFSGLDTLAAGYQHLQIRMITRLDVATTNAGLRVNLNGDTGSNYASHHIEGDGGGVYANANTSQSFARIGFLPGTSIASAAWGAAVFDLLDFNSSSKNSTMRTLSGFADDSGLSGTPRIYLRSAFWNNTAAVTSIAIGNSSAGNFFAGSRFSLYGVK